MSRAVIPPAVAALVLLSISGPALAQATPGSPPPADAPAVDGDLEARFARMDADRDGSVSKTEFMAVAADGMRRLVARGGPAAESSGATALPVEATRALDGLFVRLDQDGNGVLSLAEVRSGRDRLRVD